LFTQVLTTASANLKSELGRANLTVGGALGGQETLIQPATEALSSLSQHVESAEAQLDSILQPLVDAHPQLDGLFNQLGWSLEQSNDFSVNRWSKPKN
jgi:hypothetical protein